MQHEKDYALNLDQQGDVLLYKIDSLPDDAVMVKPVNGMITLALGEATGHHHSIVADDEIELYEKNGVLYCRNMSNDNKWLTHQEHKQIFVEPGVFEIGIVREVDPFAEEIRAVRD